MIELSWSEFKALITNEIEWFYSQKVTIYELYGVFGSLTIKCVLTDSSDISDFETNVKPTVKKYKQNITVFSQPPFAAKTIGDKKLFKRVHGVKAECIVGENILEFIVPYDTCKITGIELLWGSEGDTCDLEVYDTPTGTISTIPNYKLNQFGFSVNVAVGHYEHKSEYDADLIKFMKLEIHYYATQAKTIGINFILNELK